MQNMDGKKVLQNVVSLACLAVTCRSDSAIIARERAHGHAWAMLRQMMRVARVVAISRARVSLPSRVRGVYNARRDMQKNTRAHFSRVFVQLVRPATRTRETRMNR